MHIRSIKIGIAEYTEVLSIIRDTFFIRIKTYDNQ